jgi:hypothetical protein
MLLLLLLRLVQLPIRSVGVVGMVLSLGNVAYRCCDVSNKSSFIGVKVYSGNENLDYFTTNEPCFGGGRNIADCR